MNFMKSHSLLCSFLFCHQHAIGKFAIHSLSPCYVCVLCFSYAASSYSVIMEALVWKKKMHSRFIFLFLLLCTCCEIQCVVLSIFVYEPENQHEIFPLTFLLACLHFHFTFIYFFSCNYWTCGTGNWLKRSSLSGLADGVEDLLDISSVDRLSFIRQSSKVRTLNLQCSNVKIVR